MSDDLYQKLGASASKAGLHDALKKAGISEDSGLFAAINNDLAGDPEYCSLVHCDGAGTKSIVSYLAFRETGDPSWFKTLAQDALVMNSDDILCVGPAQKLIVANAIGRNAALVPDSAIAEIISGYKELVASLISEGVPIEMSGGETADVGDVVRTLLVDAVVTARIKRSELVNTKNITSGDVIVGLSSTGRASYETSENSGIGSNGLTLARHALLKHEYAQKYPEILAPEADSSHAYQGSFSLSDTPEGLGMSIAEAILSPTRTYAPVLVKMFSVLGPQIHAAIHTTGGALTKVLRFGPGSMRFVKDTLFETPALFALIQEEANVSWKEMYQVFNMGQRLELYVPTECAEEIISISNSFNVDAKIIGRVEKNSKDTNCVVVSDKGNTFEYEL